ELVQCTTSLHPAQEPTIMVVIGDEVQVPFLVDTGATFTSIGKEGSKLPLTRKAIKTVGFSGKTQTLRFTEPQWLTVEGTTVQAPLLYSSDTPANLLGRDVLCKLGAKIHCGPTGVWVTLPEVIAHQYVALGHKDERCALDKYTGWK
ncbi:MAG: aspartyl protease family protein, partial [Cetobacterium sp.]|uniref:aspartyl protease family protein n=1 Tax=Cetobacterium sp. TaxID=2071632 RepID=UPI003F3F8F57